MFKIGDKVNVKTPTTCYADYSKIAKVLELKKWRSGYYPLPNTVGYEITAKCFHEMNTTLLYILSDKNHEYIMDEKGLVAVPAKHEYCIHCDVTTKEALNWVVTANDKAEAYDMFADEKKKFGMREVTKELVLDSIEEVS